MNDPEKINYIIHDNSLSTLSKKSNITTLIDSFYTNNILKVKELLNDNYIDINVYSKNGNAFYWLLFSYKHNTNLVDIDLLKLFINNPSFKMDAENIRNCIRLLDIKSPFHQIIIDYIIKKNIISILEPKEKTDLILIISEYFNHISSRKSYKKYIQLFSDKELLESQNYLIEHFESFFENYHYSKNSTSGLKNKVQKLIRQILIDKKDFTDIYKNNIKAPDAKLVFLGEDIKYSEIIIALIYFNDKQHKVKNKKFSCLFRNPKKFFIFFSMHIRTHNHFLDDDINHFLKTMQIKYNLSSINWDNRYFNYESFDLINNKIENSIIDTLKFFNLKDLSPIHLKLKSPPHHNYNALFWNTYNFFLPKNIYTIQLHKQGLLDSEASLIHEVTHYLHFHPKNAKCFSSSLWKTILDKIYLHKERYSTLISLSEVLNQSKTITQINEIEAIFEKSLYLTLLGFIRKTQPILNNYGVSEEAQTNIYNIFKQYKLNSYKNSLQFISWKKAFTNHKLGPHYLNRRHEVHARLNEILSGKIAPVSKDNSYLTDISVPFKELKQDLITFNGMLLANLSK